jgi:hypothetical protein
VSTEVHRSRWSRPLIGIASVAVIGAGLGAFFGIRAVQGAGSTPPAAQPPARTNAAMAYDASNGSVVLFGGASNSHTLNDTWIWDGSGWTQAHPTTTPPALTNPQMTYDPVSHDVLLVGGQEFERSNNGPVACSGGSSSGSSGSSRSTTTFIPPANPVPAIAPVPSAKAKASQGTSAGCTSVIAPNAATWLWNGSDWSRASGLTPDGVFGSGGLATDPVSGRVVLLPRGPFAEPAAGVAQPAIACPLQSTATPDAQPKCPWPITIPAAWTWNGHQWNVMASNVTTSSLDAFGSSIIDDAVSGKLATFSGNVARPVPTPFPCQGCAGGNALQPSATNTASESVWNGKSWDLVITYDGGPPMPGVAFVGDPAAHSDVALSGDGQTWIWTGVWTQVHPHTTPPIVSGAASVYDAKTGQAVIFGGSGTIAHRSGLLDATWTWDGSNWTQRSGSAGVSVSIPVPSPVSVPPASPCNPIEPAQPGVASLSPAVHCNGSTGNAGAVSGAATGSGSGVAAP